MKISIQQEDVTSYIEFEDFDLHDFATHLRSILHTVWLPEQVDEMMPIEESLSSEFEQVRKEAYDEGYENGYDGGYKEGEAANAKSAEAIFEEGRAEGFEEGKAKGYEEGIDEAISSVEGYEWQGLVPNAKLAETTDDIRKCIREGKDNAEKSNILCKQDSSNIL